MNKAESPKSRPYVAYFFMTPFWPVKSYRVHFLSCNSSCFLLNLIFITVDFGSVCTEDIWQKQRPSLEIEKKKTLTAAVQTLALQDWSDMHHRELVVCIPLIN